ERKTSAGLTRYGSGRGPDTSGDSPPAGRDLQSRDYTNGTLPGPRERDGQRHPAVLLGDVRRGVGEQPDPRQAEEVFAEAAPQEPPGRPEQPEQPVGHPVECDERPQRDGDRRTRD